ncbi:hypothetical protein I3843_01G113500 [Carya illinoinensis]|uniref:Uncharacterized protein n=1 Tax=Carya illinoinensis TaxID=32201 RepID=A0A922G2G2_CARIL|nr:hypothetical protein I3760_01G118000 [Carya illinoinensis]KAG6731262.1 hypothetical protein I3842_01G120200 [Carya illinoinensis]KAG6731263.1 hypothetical protein I3842_01G120200 [Carya illinoinensis]KAG7995531.1 hypothetical protein I3843_01G113500 [Carya illinoinensis]
MARSAGSNAVLFHESSKKSPALALVLMLFLGLFLLVTLFHRPSQLPKIRSKLAPHQLSLPRQLLSLPPPYSTDEQYSSTMELHPKHTKNSTNRQYHEVAAHEVPSGPNPESN